MTYIKHIEGRFKQGKRDEAVQIIVDFYNGLVGKVKGFKGFIMTGSLDDPQKAVNISLWKQGKKWITIMQTIKTTPLF